jgi:hypothetical protein
MIVSLTAFECRLLYRGRYIRAVACFIAAGVTAAVRYWDYKTLDVRYDFQHLLGHAVYDECLGNPVPDIEVIQNHSMIPQTSLAVHNACNAWGCAVSILSRHLASP